MHLSPNFREFMFVGSSASPGQLTSSHYVMGWSYCIDGIARTPEILSLPPLLGAEKKHSHTDLAVAECVAPRRLVSLVSLRTPLLSEKKMELSLRPATSSKDEEDEQRK
ncbi:hypothetical protein NL676_015681 [Syzygium grande]|nr:hypothetical protein NL676_015681 [Syzygium grande]